jgi:acetolactate synthase regulatory subunit
VEAPKRHRPRPRTVVVAAAAAIAAVAIGLAGFQTTANDSSASFRETGAAIGGGTGGATDGGAAYDAGADVLEDAAPVPLEPQSEPASPSSAGGTGSVGQATDAAKVIRTGSLDLEVQEGAFQSTLERITAQTVGLGGYIAEATTSESSDSPSGSITVRVPGESFDQLLSDLRKLGDVKAVTSKGTDVTAQFTDLAARETALVATRDRLDAVLAEADTVTDILAVQDRITAVQVEIELVKGQQQLLEDQTAFGTLAITLGEPGAEIIEAERAGDGGLGGAWDDARRRFGDNIETIVSWSGSAAVALAVGLGVLLLVRLVWVGARRRMV